MELITTVGAADANSYGSLAEASAYCSGHLYASGWQTTEDRQIAALVMATRGLDAMPGAWTGAPASEVQALGWPRTGMRNRNGFALASGEIPAALKHAQFEYALQLLASNRFEDNAIAAMGISSVSAGGVSVSFAKSEVSDDPMKTRWLRQLDAQRAAVPDAVIALLVPSWLVDVREQDEEFSGLLFEAL